MQCPITVTMCDLPIRKPIRFFERGMDFPEI